MEKPSYPFVVVYDDGAGLYTTFVCRSDEDWDDMFDNLQDHKGIMELYELSLSPVKLQITKEIVT
jgi:hypothetical protein